jgi:hypothetical protein
MTNYDLSLLKSDLIENPTARCACALVLDVSSSMSGEAIEELNAGVIQLIEELRHDEFASYAVEVGVFTFGDKVREVLPFTPRLSDWGLCSTESVWRNPYGGGSGTRDQPP